MSTSSASSVVRICTGWDGSWISSGTRAVFSKSIFFSHSPLSPIKYPLDRTAAERASE